MTEISILVAAYNDESHLRDCLDSLTEQTLRDIQIICIDDGSTDGSLRIMHEYAARDSRIAVVHLDHNQGMAKARNTGLRMAEGRYVAFLDSDDWLSEDAMEKVADTYRMHPDTDTVLLNAMRCSGDRKQHKGHPLRSKPFVVLGGKEAFELSLDWSIHGIYVTRREMYQRFPYDDSCMAYSDENTTRAHYYFSREVRTCDGIYFYRDNPRSITNSISGRRFLTLRADESMRRAMEEWHVGERLVSKWEDIRWARLIDAYLFYHIHAHELSADERKAGLEAMRHAWSTIERTKTGRRARRKLGYHPMPCWTLFRMQEWTYFTLRGCIGRNNI